MSKNLDEIINKSLDEIDAIVDEINKGMDTGELSKAVDDEDVSPDEVSDDEPQEDDKQQEDDAPDNNDAPQEDDAPADDAPADSDSDNEPEEDEGQDDDYEKSLDEELNGNDSVRKALEVSEFLNELVKGISSVLSKHGDSINKSISSTETSQELLAKSFNGIVKSQKAVLETQSRLMKSVGNLTARINKLESTPMTRKSVPSAKAIEKSFAASAGDKPVNEKLNKSLVLNELSKAVSEGKNQFISDILALEGTGDLSALSLEAKHLLNIQ
jgi:hypothetical protein